MPFDPSTPYNDLPLLPPKQEIETVRVLKKAVAARAALAELNGMIRLIPNPTILLNTLILEEARDSSTIENIITTRDELYRALVTNERSIEPATKEVLRYRKALWRGYDTLQKSHPLTTNLLITVQETLVENTAGIRKLPGTALVNDTTGSIIYSPPVGEQHIRDLLANLEQFIHTESEIEPLVKLALIHYQFEAIHPFYDGNGRTGRILNVLYLVKAGLLDLPILYLSNYIIRNKDEYYNLLLGVTREAMWKPWIFYLLDAIEKTSRDTIAKINRIRVLLDETISTVRHELPKIYSKELVELLFEQPYTRIQFLVERGIAQRQTASVYLQALEQIGVLESLKSGREVLYLNRQLYRIFRSGQQNG